MIAAPTYTDECSRIAVQNLSPNQHATNDFHQYLADLESMKMSALRDEWRRVFQSEPPKAAKELFQLALAWKAQEQIARGSHIALIKRLLASRETPTALEKLSQRRRNRLKLGTKLVREWQGKTYLVTIVEQGFEWRERHYRSLSQIAHEITGARWSGPRFFGLSKEAAKKQSKRTGNDERS